jgi:outer membrane protein TolC
MIHAVAFAAALTFNDAYARALAARGLTDAFAVRVVPPPETHPALRLEVTAQHAQDIHLRDNGVLDLGQGSALVSVDLPIVDRAARLRRTANAETDALLFRRHAIDEASQLFDETLEAFAQLVLAQRRLDLLGAAARRTNELQEHAQAQLTAGHIDNLTAASWEEQALSAQSQEVDAALQRLDAETKLEQLMGIKDPGEIEVAADLDFADAVPAPVAGLDLAGLEERKQQLHFDEVQAQRRPQVFITGYGGTIGHAGIAGVRLSIGLPFYDATRVAEAKYQLEEARRAKTAAGMEDQMRAEQLRASIDGANKRVELLARAVELARARQESVARLVAGGARNESQLALALVDTTRRQCDLLAAQVERWKLRQQQMRHSADGTVLQAAQ